MKKNTFVLVALFGILTISSCDKNQDAQAAAQMQAQPVLELKAVEVKQQNIEIDQEYPAKIEGLQNVEIRPKANGFIEKILVDEGQQVKKGQLLFKLETQTLTQDAAAAKAAVSAAQVEVDRLKPLVEQGIVGDVLLKSAQARLAQAKAAYSSVAANINYANVYSPANGVIGALPHKVGALVNSTINPALTTVSDTRQIRAYFNLNERQMLSFSKNVKGNNISEKIKNAPKVKLKLVDGSIFNESGNIAAINGLIDANTGSTQFRADFNNPQSLLRSGSSAMLLLPTSYENAIVIPQKAVLDLQGKNLVYVVGKDGKAQSKVVEIVNQSQREYVIGSGLEAGDVILVEGLSKVKDGQDVKATVVASLDEPTETNANQNK